MSSRAGGTTSGFVDMLGSRLGGFTAARGSGSPCSFGTCWMPGSIWDGGMGGTPDSNGFSRVKPGADSPPLIGGAGGTPSAEMASAGTRLRMAMATTRETLPDHLLVESERGTLPNLCFDHDIFTSLSVMTLGALRGLDLRLLPAAPLMITGTGTACFCLSAIRRTKFFPRFGRTRTGWVGAWFFRHEVPPCSVMSHERAENRTSPTPCPSVVYSIQPCWLLIIRSEKP